ncbi:Cytochrome subunit of sulfide dehydrogenase [Gammaproteobacteria bacterium]
MYNKINAALVVAVVLGVSTPALAEQALATGSMLANNCTGCHGIDGASHGPSIPSIGGLSKEYLVGIMKAYQEGKAYSTIMGRIAKGYTEDEIKVMADYYAGKPFVSANQKFDAKLSKNGESLHEKYCGKCHEEKGSSSDEAGILTGQWMPYLQWTIADFKGSKREAEKKMLTKLEQLLADKGDAGLDALLNYYARQKK